MLIRLVGSGLIALSNILVLAAPAATTKCSDEPPVGSGGTGGAPPKAVCGDGIKDDSEQCDGKLGVYACQFYDPKYGSGQLKCTSNCKYDTSACALSVCGDGLIQGVESCEGTNLGEFKHCTD